MILVLLVLLVLLAGTCEAVVLSHRGGGGLGGPAEARPLEPPAQLESLIVYINLNNNLKII